MITPNTTMGKIEKDPHFSSFSKLLIPTTQNAFFEKVTRKMTLAKYTLIGSENRSPEDVAHGLNTAAKLIDSGVPFVQNIWSAKDIKNCSEKKETGLFYFPSKVKNPFVIIMAGGAYFNVASIVEGFPVAEVLNSMGYTAFVLKYRCGGKKKRYPAPIEDLKQAIRYIFQNAESLNIETDGYAVMGFSAGGHLAAEWGTVNYGWRTTDLPAPAALILGYPPISFIHPDNTLIKGALLMMLGKKHTEDQINSICIDKNMDDNFPPTYLWHCKDDPIVPFEMHATTFQEALDKHNIEYKFNQIEHGGHGLGLATGTDAANWLKDAVSFWQSQLQK